MLAAPSNRMLELSPEVNKCLEWFHFLATYKSKLARPRAIEGLVHITNNRRYTDRMVIVCRCCNGHSRLAKKNLILVSGNWAHALDPMLPEDQMTPS